MTTLSRAIAFGAAFGLMLACGIVIGLVIDSQYVRPIFKARVLAVADESGKVTGYLKSGSSDHPDGANAILVLNDAEGHSRISLSVDKEGQSRILLRNREGVSRLYAAVWSDGKVSFSLLNDAGKGGIVMYTEPKGPSQIGFTNEKGTVLSTWGNTGPSPGLQFLTGNGDVRATFPPIAGK